MIPHVIGKCEADASTLLAQHEKLPWLCPKANRCQQLSTTTTTLKLPTASQYRVFVQPASKVNEDKSERGYAEACPMARRKRRVKGKGKEHAQGPTLSHTTGQEVFDGDTLPSCHHTDHQHRTPFSLTSYDRCEACYGGQHPALYFVQFILRFTQSYVAHGNLFSGKLN